MCKVHGKTQQHLAFVNSPANPADPADPAEVVSRSALRSPTPLHRAGGQDDVSFTNSLKIAELKVQWN